MKNIHLLLSIMVTATIAGCGESQSSDKQSDSKESRQVTITVQQVIRQGATFCVEQRSMLKVQAMERANNPYVQMPGDCEIAPQPIPIQVHSQNNLGIASVYNKAGRALVQQKDLETIQVRN